MSENTLPEASGAAEYETLLLDVSRLLEHARRSAGRAVNAIMTGTYWQIGRRIVEQEQRGSSRASYGEEACGEAVCQVERNWQNEPRDPAARSLEQIMPPGFPPCHDGRSEVLPKQRIRASETACPP
jgi:hypothetical protein